MSFVLASVLIFLLENVFRSSYRLNGFRFFTKRQKSAINAFVLIADLFLLFAIGLNALLPRIESLLIFLLVNCEETISEDGIRTLLSAIKSCFTFEITPVDLSVILVLFLAYFGSIIAPGILCACLPVVDAPMESQRRDTGQSGFEKRPEIKPGGKLFLKLCHLLN